MRDEEIVEKLGLIHTQSYLLKDFDAELQVIKEEYVIQNKQEDAKRLWVYQTIVEIHELFVESFSLLKAKQYYQGWCKLETIEITIAALKKHLQYDKKQFFLWHIEKSTKNLQVIFPYRLFSSSEILKKKKKCSVCDKELSIRNPCGHIVGEIYNGEMCYRIVTEAELLGVSLVYNPGNKYAVMFLKDEKTDKQIDQYKYDTVDYLFELIESPYQPWDLEVMQREIKKEDYGDISRNDLCSCGSCKKFKKCCMKHIGKKYPHYEFILQDSSDKTLFTNTLKTRNADSQDKPLLFVTRLA